MVFGYCVDLFVALMTAIVPEDDTELVGNVILQWMDCFGVCFAIAKTDEVKKRLNSKCL